MATFPVGVPGSRGSSFSANGDEMRRRASAVQSLAKLEQNNAKPADTDALFASIKETYWTVADHHRLYAIDRLQTRIMEYHNNVHQRDKNAAASSMNVRPDDVVAFLMTCSASSTNKMFQPVEMGSLPSLLKKTRSFVNGKPKTGLEWYHMMDLSALSVIANELKLDILCREHFRDLRFQSMELPVVGGCCMSFCYFQLDPFTLSVGMFKLYFYVTHGFVLTFVAELMPDTDASKTLSRSQNPIDRDARTVQEFLQQQEDVPLPIDAVFNAVAERWELLVDRASELGPMYVFYELASEALAAQDSLMEFLSRSIFHFKRKTSFRLSYRKKLQLVKRLHIVNTAISMVESCTSHASLVVAGLMKTVTDRSMVHMRPPEGHSESDGFALDGLVPPAVLGVRQLPVLYDLRNSYSFVNECLRNEAKEVREVSDAIDSISQMRADHTALVLSLIATIFLPATFLTGVFGMNFQEHGGFTISIVNSPYGPTVFYCLCVVLAISLCVYYITMGWIEAFSPVRAALKVLLGKEGMIAVLGEDFEEDVNDDPAEKHPKMVSVEGLVHDGDSDHGDGTEGVSPAELANRLAGERNKELSGVVRSPLPASSDKPPQQGRANSRARSSGGGSVGGGRTKSNMMVPQRVAEALEEENRRHEEARRRRELAQLQGMQPSTSGLAATAAAGSLCSTQLLPSTLQHRSRSVNRANSTEGSAGAVRK